MDATEDGVGCYDAMGRRRRLKLSRSERGITIVVPPGEAADMDPAEIDELRVCLARLAVSGVKPAFRTTP